ncbi:MAG TPA: DUF3781 domain-containing protein [Bacteroidales bacterium]|nr:DUF3781 domain-containing protein [Bacteroidales bacterium]
MDKQKILDSICYTELVYERINKKLNLRLSKHEIEEMLYAFIKDTDERYFQRIGKNIYIASTENNIRITINSSTYRIITVDRISKMQ